MTNVSTIMPQGQVTFKKEVLQHLGLQPGENVRLELFPNARVELKAVPPQGSWRDLSGILKGKGNGRQLSIEEINDAIAEAGATAGMGE